ncbi:MAG: hypothetical protein ACLT1A_04750 [Dysosmobacter sp.]
MGNIGGLHRHGKAVILEKLVPRASEASAQVQHPTLASSLSKAAWRA